MIGFFQNWAADCSFEFGESGESRVELFKEVLDFLVVGFDEIEIDSKDFFFTDFDEFFEKSVVQKVFFCFTVVNNFDVHVVALENCFLVILMFFFRWVF